MGYPDFDIPEHDTGDTASLLAAVAAGYTAAGLDAGAPLHAGRAAADASAESLPYVVVTLDGGRPVLSTAEIQVDEVRLTFKVRALTVAAARAVATDLDAWMLSRRFTWTDGDSAPAVRAGWTKGEEKGLGKGARAVFCDTLVYTLKVRGSR